MKKLTLVFAFMLAVAGAAAQSMYVHKTDGNVYEFKVSDVDSINFAASTTDDYLCTVTYMPNGGTSEAIVDTVRYGCSYTIKLCTFSYPEYGCAEWNTATDGKGVTYFPAESIVVMKNIILYAQWRYCVYVDLGLPSGTKWATCNVGAATPEEYGNYYAWGETEPKTTYNWVTYKWCNGSYTTLTKYGTSSKYGTVDNKTVLDPEDDAAAINWGSVWRMPTDDEWRELLDNCTWTWTTLNGVNGYKVKGANGNSIFLPAAGYRDDDDLFSAGDDGYYWSSSLGTGSPSSAWRVHFYSGNVDRVNYRYSRYFGLSVRPVL